MQNLIVFVIMLALCFVMLIVPENKRKKKYASMLEALKVNDEIMTRGGIIGKIINMQDTFLIVESGPDRTRFKLDKSAIATIINVEEKLEEKKDK